MRAHTIAASFIVAAIGYITVKPLGLYEGAVLFFLVAMIHTSGCILNDYYDYSYDKDDPGKSDRPLVKQGISVQYAKYAGYTIMLVGLAIAASISSTLFAVGLVSATLGIYYNKYSKENILSELAFTGWEVSLVFVGAAYAGSATILTGIVSIFIAIQAFYQIQEGSLKDIDGNETTLLSRIGAFKSKYTGYLVPRWFIGVSTALKVAQVVLVTTVLWLGINMEVPMGSELPSIQILMVLSLFGLLGIVGSVFLASFRYCFTKSETRSEVIKSFTVHELAGAVMLLFAVIPVDPAGAIATTVFSVAWVGVVNWFIHSGPIHPDI